MTVLEQARAMLEELTPLWMDCGRVCGGACCHSMEGEETGMRLFPGEEKLYADLPDYQVRPSPIGYLLVCKGKCERHMRPLSCRIFPLLPLIREDGIKVAMDARAKAVCPLAWQGKNALNPDFVEAVGRVGELLISEPAQVGFLLRLTEEHDQLRELRRKFTGR